MRYVPSAVWCLLWTCFVVFFLSWVVFRDGPNWFENPPWSLWCGLCHLRPVDLIEQELISHTLKTAFKLDRSLYFLKEKLSNIAVKFFKKYNKKTTKTKPPFATNINTFCQFSLHLSSLVLSPHIPFLSLFFFMVFLVASRARQCISLKLLTE